MRIHFFLLIMSLFLAVHRLPAMGISGMEIEKDVVRAQVENMWKEFDFFITVGKDPSDIKVENLNTALINLQRVLDIKDDQDTQIFREAYEEFFKKLDIIHHFIFENRVFDTLKESLNSFKGKLENEDFITDAKTKKNNFDIFFQTYLDYYKRYYLENYLYLLNSENAKSLQSQANFNSLEVQADQLEQQFTPDELFAKLITEDLIKDDTKDIITTEIKKLKKINDLIGFDGSIWPQMLTKLSEKNRQRYLNLVEAIIITDLFIEKSEEKLRRLQDRLPETQGWTPELQGSILEQIQQLNNDLKDIVDIQPYLIENKIPLLYHVEKMIQALTPKTTDELRSMLLELSVNVAGLNKQL